MVGQEALILDAEAVSALAYAEQRAATAKRAQAVMKLADMLGAPVRVPSVVLAELYRGGGRDAAIDRVLAGQGLTVVDATVRIARKAGALLARAKLDSSHAVDAFVVATGALYERAIIATHDPDDIGALAAGERGIRVWRI